MTSATAMPADVVGIIFLRATRAWANSLGYSLPMIGALLGHSQYQTTLRYAHLADTQLRQAAEHISKAIAETKQSAGKVVQFPKR